MRITAFIIRHGFICYKIMPNGEEKPIYIGACRPHEALSLNDAMKNSACRSLFTDTTRLEFQVLSEHATLAEAEQARDAYVIEIAPYCNLAGIYNPLPDRRGKSGGRIRDETTMTIYENASTACKMLGIAPSAMSNHLKGAQYYNTVGGRTFTRVED